MCLTKVTDTDRTQTEQILRFHRTVAARAGELETRATVHGHTILRLDTNRRSRRRSPSPVPAVSRRLPAVNAEPYATTGSRSSCGTDSRATGPREHPAAVFGLDVESMHTLLNSLGDKAADGVALTDGQQHSDVVDGLPLALRTTRGSWFPTFFGRATSFYQRPPLPVLQLLWPDADGRFPWHPESGEARCASPPQL